MPTELYAHGSIMSGCVSLQLSDHLPHFNVIADLCGDCQQLLKRHGALAEPAVHTIMDQLFDALTCVHSRGILHRDVKLENILVTTAVSPQIKVRHLVRASVQGSA